MYEKLLNQLREGDVKSFRNFVRMDPEMFTQMVEDLTPKLQKKTTSVPWTQAGHHSEVSSHWGLLQVTGLWVPRYPEHHRQCCARGVPSHLRPLLRDSLQVSHNRRAVEGGGPGLLRQVELPSLLCCIDGKHVGMQALYYNYKRFYSIITLALVDANCKFLYVDVGARLWC